MAIEYYSSIDLNKNELQNAVIQNLGSAPGSPVEGQIYYDTGDDVIYFRNGSAWVSVGGDITGVTAGAGMTGGGTTGTVTLNVIGGNGITANANDVAITAAQTTITSVLNTSLVVGRDATDQIKFSTDNQIIFRVGGGDGVTFKASGEIEATSLDISGNADIDGDLTGLDNITSTNYVVGGHTIDDIDITAEFVDADAHIMSSKAIGARFSLKAGSSSIVTTGALDSGSITSGFGTIDTGASAITTTGLISGGSLDIDDVLINGSNIGHTDDTDLIALADGAVTVNGSLTVTGTTTTNNVETVSTSSGVIFEGTAADGHDATLLSVVASSDKTYTLPNVTGYVGLFAADPSTTTISSTPAELNKLDGATVVVAEINYNDLGSTAVGTAIASKTMVLDSNKDFTGVRHFTLSGELDAGSLDVEGDADINGTLETDALTIGGAAVLAQATASAVGAVELATAAEVLTGTDTARVVTADTLSAKSVVATIAQSSLTDDNRVTITHALGTADVIVQLFDMTTEANVHADIARTTDDMSTASTSVITIDFGRAPANDVRCLITSLKGATAAGTIAYT